MKVIEKEKYDGKPKIKNLKELKANGYKSKSIKDELSDNLSELIKSGKPSFQIYMVMKTQ